MYPLYVSLGPEQALFQETSRKFLESESPLVAVRALADDPLGFDRTLWRRAADLGWFGLLVPPELGGGCLSGSGVFDLSIVASEIGRLVHPGPVLPTSVVAGALADDGSAEQRQEVVPRLVSGEAIGAWCFPEPEVYWGGGSGVAVSARDGTLVLAGQSPFVQDAQAADVLLVTAKGPEGFSQFLLPADFPGVTVSALESLDLARRMAHVELDDVVVPPSMSVGPLARSAAHLDRQLQRAVVLQCAETVGAIDRVFEFTLQYAKDRVAFGHPIGSYQAIKHRLSDMLVTLESCKAASLAATEAVDGGDPAAAELVSIAKSFIGRAAPALVQECVQIHGGIGVTWDHDLHLYLRRVASNAALYGSAEAHDRRLSTLLAGE